jgi:hypothetical protein
MREKIPNIRETSKMVVDKSREPARTVRVGVCSQVPFGSQFLGDRELLEAGGDAMALYINNRNLPWQNDKAFPILSIFFKKNGCDGR